MLTESQAEEGAGVTNAFACPLPESLPEACLRNNFACKPVAPPSIPPPSPPPDKTLKDLAQETAGTPAALVVLLVLLFCFLGAGALCMLIMVRKGLIAGQSAPLLNMGPVTTTQKGKGLNGGIRSDSKDIEVEVTVNDSPTPSTADPSTPGSARSIPSSAGRA